MPLLYNRIDVSVWFYRNILHMKRPKFMQWVSADNRVLFHLIIFNFTKLTILGLYLSLRSQVLTTLVGMARVVSDFFPCIYGRFSQFWVLLLDLQTFLMSLVWNKWFYRVTLFGTRILFFFCTSSIVTYKTKCHHK